MDVRLKTSNATGTYIAETWPQYVIDGLFNLGVPAARRYMTNFLSAVAGSYNLTVLRFDFNMDPAASWQSHDVANRSVCVLMPVANGSNWCQSLTTCANADCRESLRDFTLKECTRCGTN